MEINLDDNILQFRIKECKEYYNQIMNKVNSLDGNEKEKFINLINEQGLESEIKKINNITAIPPLDYVYYLNMFDSFIEKIKRVIRFID
jgi:hypothetical protein